MFESIKALFGAKTKKPPVAPPQQPPAPGGAPQEGLTPVIWLSADDPRNPFVFDGYDCLAFVQSMRSTTQDPNIAASFATSRNDPGRHHIGQLPEEAVELLCDLAYASEEDPTDGVLFKASAMEQKWDIYQYSNRFYFARSWTAMLVFVAEFEVAEGKLRIPRIWAAAQSAELAVQRVDYLFKSHVLKRACAHPLPDGIRHDEVAVGFYSFGEYGRLCCFGSFDDVMVAEPLKAGARREQAQAPDAS